MIKKTAKIFASVFFFTVASLTLLFVSESAYNVDLFPEKQRVPKVKASTTNNNITEEIPDFLVPPFKKGSYKDFVSNSRVVKTIDFYSNKPLYEKNADERVQIASLTKIMTALLAYENKSTEDIVTVPVISNRTGEAVIGLRTGEKIKVGELLNAILIHSAGDAAQTLAVNIAGSEEKFVEMMNERAKELGLLNTNFTNPVGYNDTGNYSTANDLVTLSRLFLAHDYLRNIVSKQTYTAKNESGREYFLKNTNKLLDGTKFFGVKTGYTVGAGECLIAFAKVNNQEILTVVLGSPDRFGETNNLIGWVFANWEW